MSTETFSPGDVVKLKSGGPAMTVAGKASAKLGGGLVCDWFDGTDKKSGVFQPEMLLKRTDRSIRAA